MSKGIEIFFDKNLDFPLIFSFIIQFLLPKNPLISKKLMKFTLKQ